MISTSNNKIFIIGLPRTATTSVCVALLEMGIKTAHTAYWQMTFEQATAIADTPVFCDYQALDRHYPKSKFVYLTRTADKWLPSIRQLLLRMHDNLVRDDGGFNPVIKRCYQTVFAPFTLENIQSDEFLLSCYQKHQLHIEHYFANRKKDLLTINVSEPDSFNQLCDFLAISSTSFKSRGFQPLNMGGKVTAWNQIKHPLKVASTNNGKVGKMEYDQHLPS